MVRYFILLMMIPRIILAQENSELAESQRDHQVIDRNHFTLSYNPEHKVANWVAYNLNPNKLQSCVSRTNSFRTDPELNYGSASLEDYRNSGYDRGHLVPSGDSKFDSEAMRESFFLSNITPQSDKFNRGAWGQLEVLMRAWALKYGKIWIVTGPVLEKGLKTIGKNKVSVPNYHFKVILRREGSSFRGIAFLMPSDVPYPDLEAYALSVREVEQLTDIDFFHFMPPSEANRVETRKSLKHWDFQANFNYLPCSA
jgi:endonuclease G, mitochondrial